MNPRAQETLNRIKKLNFVKIWKRRRVRITEKKKVLLGEGPILDRRDVIEPGWNGKGIKSSKMVI